MLFFRDYILFRTKLLCFIENIDSHCNFSIILVFKEEQTLYVDASEENTNQLLCFGNEIRISQYLCFLNISSFQKGPTNVTRKLETYMYKLLTYLT